MALLQTTPAAPAPQSPPLAQLVARALRAGSFALCALALASVGGCKNKKKDSCNPEDYVFEELALHLQASPDINVNDEGEALPTVVRIYQLNGDLATRSLDFNELWEDHESALGDEYISDKELTLFPDSAEIVNIVPEGDARFILVFAVFNSPVGNTWFRVYEIPDSYGRQACEYQKEDKDPNSLGQPCVYIYLDRNQVDGGKNVPPGFDDGQVETTCTPIYTPKTVSASDEDEEDKDKKKKDK